MIAAAARQVATDVDAIREAHEDHGLTPGPHDDLAADPYAIAAADVYRQTLSDAVVRRIGLTHGVVAVLMDLVAEHRPDETDHRQWRLMRRLFDAHGRHFAPGEDDPVSALPSLALAWQPTPAIVRFDLLAQLASRAAALRTLDAARWVAELARSIEPIVGTEADALSLALSTEALSDLGLA